MLVTARKIDNKTKHGLSCSYLFISSIIITALSSCSSINTSQSVSHYAEYSNPIFSGVIQIRDRIEGSSTFVSCDPCTMPTPKTLIKHQNLIPNTAQYNTSNYSQTSHSKATPFPDNTNVTLGSLTPTNPPKALSPDTLTSMRDKSWINLQSPLQYTIQLIGSRDEIDITRMSRAHGLSDSARYTIIRKGAPWYAMIYGTYPTVAAARSEIEKFPPSMLTNSPWIRRFDEIQSSIRRTETKRKAYIAASLLNEQ